MYSLLFVLLFACGDRFGQEAAQPDASTAGAGGSAGTSGAAGAGGVAGAGGMGAVAGSGGADGGKLQYPEAVAASGPAAYWRFEEDHGLTVTDETGTQTGTATAEGVELGQPGAFSSSKALRIDKEGAYVNFGNVFSFPNGVPFTIELLVRLTTFGSGSHNLLWKYESADKSGWITQLWPGAQGLRVVLYNADDVTLQEGLPIQEQQWTYVAFAYSGSRLCIYRGQPPSSKVQELCKPAQKEMAPTDAILRLGSGFQGFTDELAIYAKALPLPELEKHYAAALSEGMTAN